MKRAVRTCLFSLAALAVLWAAAALHFDGPRPAGLADALAAAYALASGALLWRARRQPRAFGAVAALFALVLAWWLSLAPSNDRDWLADVARPPTGRLDGSLLTISNVRDFSYRSETDYDPKWETRTYDLDHLEGADLFLVYWGSPWIAHTIVSWRFSDSLPLAISIETRKERGEEYSAVKGFFRQYELYYVAADERDVIGLRTDQRGEDVYLYHLTTPVAEARAVLLDYVAEMNRLAEHPRWYNALTHNCTTAIRYHLQNVSRGRPWDWRILANGRLDELAWERGTFDRSVPFAKLREMSRVNERAVAAGRSDDFSARIREGLPMPSPRP